MLLLELFSYGFDIMSLFAVEIFVWNSKQNGNWPSVLLDKTLFTDHSGDGIFYYTGDAWYQMILRVKQINNNQFIFTFWK